MEAGEGQYIEEEKSYVPNNDVYYDNGHYNNRDDSANISAEREFGGRTSDLIP